MRDPNKQITHILREANQCVDAMAKLGASCTTSFIIFLHPPPVVERILTLIKLVCVVTDLLILNLMLYPC